MSITKTVVEKYVNHTIADTTGFLKLLNDSEIKIGNGATSLALLDYTKPKCSGGDGTKAKGYSFVDMVDSSKHPIVANGTYNTTVDITNGGQVLNKTVINTYTQEFVTLPSNYSGISYINKDRFVYEVFAKIATAANQHSTQGGFLIKIDGILSIYYTNSKIRIYSTSNGSYKDLTLLDNALHHIAIVSQPDVTGNFIQIKIYLDGVYYDSLPDTAYPTVNPSNANAIGFDTVTNGTATGYLVGKFYRAHLFKFDAGYDFATAIAQSKANKFDSIKAFSDLDV